MNVTELPIVDRSAWEREQACRIDRLVERTELALTVARRERERDPWGQFLARDGQEALRRKFMR